MTPAEPPESNLRVYSAVAELRHLYIAMEHHAYCRATVSHRAVGILTALRYLAADPGTVHLMRESGIARRDELPAGAEQRVRESLTQLGQDDVTLILGPEGATP